jgi:hypothetical protein
MLISIFVYGDENAGAFRTNQVIMAIYAGLIKLVDTQWCVAVRTNDSNHDCTPWRCKFIPVFLDRISESPSLARS